jgi:hypothetical protein
MACPPDIMKQADGFMVALTAAVRYRVSGGELSLLGGDAALLATFVPQPQSLAGSSWRVSRQPRPRGAGVRPPALWSRNGPFSRRSKSVATMHMEGDGLELRTKYGELAVMLQRSPES